MAAPKSFHEYMRAYKADHSHPANKVCHMIGIPLIVASIPVTPVAPPVGATMFTVGWGFQFLGHWFEKKKPSFASDWRYLAIGPVWVAVEYAELITGRTLYADPLADVAGGAAAAGVGAGAVAASA